MTLHLTSGVRTVLLLPTVLPFALLKALNVIILLHLLKPMALTSTLKTCDATEFCMQCSYPLRIVLAFYSDRA